MSPVRADDDAAAKAVEAAKLFTGSAITVVAEAGLQALLDTQYTGPEWEKLTGIKVKVVELPFEEIYPKTILEKQAGTGGYDVVLVSPAWLADMVSNSAVEPLDAFIEKYGVKGEFDDINPAFKDWMSYKGKIYGLVVDGDVLVTYYRRDLFEDPENQKAFKENTVTICRRPRTTRNSGRSPASSPRSISQTLWCGCHKHWLHTFLLQRAPAIMAASSSIPRQ